MRKYFIVILYFFCIGNVTNSYGGEVKANYYLNINSKGALFAIYLNGIKVDDRMSESHQSISIPLNIAMKTEDNELEVVFSPVIGRDGGKYDFLIGPKESFYINLSLERVSFKNRDREKVTLLNVSYDMQEEKIVTSNTFNGQDVLYTSENIKVLEKIKYRESKRLYNPYARPFEAFSVTSSFNTKDWFPSFIWEDSQKLEVNETLKNELREAYNKLYRTIDDNNYNGFLGYMSDLWVFTAECLGLDGLQGYLSSISLDKNNLRSPGDGTTLAPLNIPKDNDDFHVEILGNGKLATTLPTPIKWAKPNGKGSILKVAFYKDKNDEWRVGAVF